MADLLPDTDSRERLGVIARVLGRRVDPSVQRVVKLMPSGPPDPGEYILVDDVRCRVTRCRVSWREPGIWTIKSLRVKEARRG